MQDDFDFLTVHLQTLCLVINIMQDIVIQYLPNSQKLASVADECAEMGCLWYSFRDANVVRARTDL